MHDSMVAEMGERSVEVKREDLLKKLKENRQKHQQEYQESLAGYKRLANERLTKLEEKFRKDFGESVAAVRRKIEQFDPEAEDSLTDRVVVLQAMAFDLKVPRDHTEAYDVAIQMAEWEVNETVVLTQSQFQRFVRDDWDWQREHKFLNARYSVGR